MGCNSPHNLLSNADVNSSKDVSPPKEVTITSNVDTHSDERLPNQLFGMIEDEILKIIINANIDEEMMNYNTIIEFINKSDGSIDLIADCGLFISNDEYATKDTICLAVESKLLKKNSHENQSIMLDKEFLNTDSKIITIKYRQDKITKDLQLLLKEGDLVN